MSDGEKFEIKTKQSKKKVEISLWAIWNRKQSFPGYLKVWCSGSYFQYDL